MALFIIFLLAVAAGYYSSRSESLERLGREVTQLKIKIERLAAGGTGGEKPAQARTGQETSPEREELPPSTPAEQTPVPPEK